MDDHSVGSADALPVSSEAPVSSTVPEAEATEIARESMGVTRRASAARGEGDDQGEPYERLDAGASAIELRRAAGREHLGA